MVKQQAIIMAEVLGGILIPTQQFFNLEVKNLLSGEEVFQGISTPFSEVSTGALLPFQDVVDYLKEKGVAANLAPRLKEFSEAFFTEDRIQAGFDFVQDGLIQESTFAEHLVEFSVEGALSAFVSDDATGYIDPALSPADPAEVVDAIKAAIAGEIPEASIDVTDDVTEEETSTEESADESTEEETPAPTAEEADSTTEEETSTETGISIPVVGEGQLVQVDAASFTAALEGTVKALGRVADAVQISATTNQTQAKVNQLQAEFLLAKLQQETSSEVEEAEVVTA